MGKKRTNDDKRDSSAPNAKYPWKAVECIAERHKGEDQVPNATPESNGKATKDNTNVADKQTSGANVK